MSNIPIEPVASGTEHSELANSGELAVLRAIVEGTAQASGKDFFRSLVYNLSTATGVASAFVAEFADSRTRVRTIAFWKNGEFVENQEWELAGTPCEEVLRGHFCHHASDVWKLFPTEAGVESYLGVPLKSHDGQIIGHLAMFDSRAMPPEPRLLYTFKIFAARAAAELNQLRAIERLRSSEEHFRDLFDEAPIAYVQEGLDSKFISANRAAMTILGITPEQVPGTFGLSFVPNTPEAQRLVREAFASIGRGTDTSGVVLELRRKDNNKPIWIQWWSKPDPSGQYTRTMFIDITDKVLMEREQARLQAQNQYLREEIEAVRNFEEIIGHSPAIRTLLDGIRRVAATDASVLIQGESGTGKELIARAIHSASKRRDKPLIKINCASLPAGLVESELFGHEKGAFTGAIAKRSGRFELADGGTIFLDEIGEMPLDVQAKLLRVLQEREFDRVGGKTPVKVDVRVIAATNRNLFRGVAEKTFRDDLYYRLNVFPLFTPPLRERIEDIPMLTAYLIDKFSKRMDKRVAGISEQSLKRLQSYDWPGNIRELENVIERAMILSDEPIIEIDLGWFSGAGQAAVESPGMEAGASLESVERRHISAVLQSTDWVIEGKNGAAQILAINPSTLRYRMKKLGISKAGHPAQSAVD